MSRYAQKAIPELLARAQACAAPIGELRNIKPARWHQSPMGQTYAPPKVLRDLRNGRKLSLAQARQIIVRCEGGGHD